MAPKRKADGKGKGREATPWAPADGADEKRASRASEDTPSGEVYRGSHRVGCDEPPWAAAALQKRLQDRQENEKRQDRDVDRKVFETLRAIQQRRVQFPKSNPRVLAVARRLKDAARDALQSRPGVQLIATATAREIAEEAGLLLSMVEDSLARLHLRGVVRIVGIDPQGHERYQVPPGATLRVRRKRRRRVSAASGQTPAATMSANPSKGFKAPAGSVEAADKLSPVEAKIAACVKSHAADGVELCDIVRETGHTKDTVRSALRARRRLWRHGIRRGETDSRFRSSTR